jgi:hypothetical protein
VTTTPKAAAEKTDVEVVDKEANQKIIPAQKTSVENAEIVEVKPTMRERLNNLVRNKRIVAGASSVALIAAAVLVVRKRNSTDEAVEETEA